MLVLQVHHVLVMFETFERCPEMGVLWGSGFLEPFEGHLVSLQKPLRMFGASATLNLSNLVSFFSLTLPSTLLASLIRVDYTPPTVVYGKGPELLNFLSMS